MPKLLIPERDNMAEAVTKLWGRTHLDESVLDTDLQDLRRYLLQREFSPATMCLVQLSTRVLFEALRLRWSGTGDCGAFRLRQSFSYFNLAHDMRRIHRRHKPLGDDMREDQLTDLINWQGLAAAGSATWFPRWTAPFLHNLFCCGAEPPVLNLFWYTTDLPARRFVVFLQEVLIRNHWPEQADTSGMGIYGRLIDAAPKPVAFSDALVDFCNDRVAQAFGYEALGGTKRRRQSALMNVHDRFTWEQAFPIELLALKHAYESTSGATLSLSVAHPLLQTNLMALPFPDLDPQYEDEVTNEVESFAALTYGAQWQRRAEIEAKYLGRCPSS
jgi:hypothetical protein